MNHDTILFLTDTHLGGDETGFWYQPRRTDLLAQIAESLAGVVRERDVDLVVHGGDHIEQFVDERLDGACDLLACLGCPAATCLGNHDLTVPSAADAWQRRRESRTEIAWADTVVRLQHTDVILLDNGWQVDGQVGRWWTHGLPCHAALSEEQFAWLDEALADGPADRPAVLVMHAPLDPLSQRLTGAEKPSVLPYDNMAARLSALLDRHARVRLALGGHNHTNQIVRRNGRLHVTATSLIENPFEYRLIRIGPGSLEVTTHAAIPCPPETPYVPEKAWVNGRPEDRTATLTW